LAALNLFWPALDWLMLSLLECPEEDDGHREDYEEDEDRYRGAVSDPELRVCRLEQVGDEHLRAVPRTPFGHRVDLGKWLGVPDVCEGEHRDNHGSNDGDLNSPEDLPLVRPVHYRRLVEGRVDARERSDEDEHRECGILP